MLDRRRPLDGWTASFAGVALRELPHLAQVTVRGETAPAGEAITLGPDEWLVLGPPGSEDSLVAVLAPHHAQAVDTTASRTVIEIAGPASTRLLQKGCGLDLHPSAFPPGRAAATLFARTGIILQRQAAERWRVFVRASYARYLRDWLVAAAG